jgi:hypothetical protein
MPTLGEVRPLQTFHEPKNVTALGTDVIGRFFVGPIEVEKRCRPGVEQRIAFMELLVPADGTCQFPFADFYLD